ncbi:MAG: DUF4097 family beta strand repeat protein [Micromonosporaceae bacterium]|nr:DUF4097 family beta strand repeat protein [Micromonosporaceae bacterium]
MKLRWFVIPFAAAVALSAAGCGIDGFRLTTMQDDKTEHVAITAVRMEGSGGGDVTVEPGSAGQVKIHRKIQYNGSQPGNTYRIDGGTLYLNTDCGHNCGVDYEVRVPEGVTVTGENGSGNVRLTGVSKVDVEVSSGDVEITRATGPVRVRANSGNIDATGVRAATTDLTADSGDITLDLDTPGNVTAQADSGNITLQVPSGTSYLVDATANSGDTKVHVPTDPNGNYHLTLHASSGDIEVNTR